MGGVSPEMAFKWINESAPFFSMPARDHIEKAYYYRWKLFLEHMRETHCKGAPVAISECRLATTRNAMLPDGSFETDHQGAKLSEDGSDGCVWGDGLGVITAASAHHIAEGRWLRDKAVTESYLRYLYREDRTSNFNRVQLSDPTIVALEDMNIKSSMKQSPQFSFKSSCPLPYQRITLRTYSAWPIRAVWQKYLSWLFV